MVWWMVLLYFVLMMGADNCSVLLGERVERRICQACENGRLFVVHMLEERAPSFRVKMSTAAANKAVASILTPSVVPYTKGSQGATIVCRAERAVPYQSLDLA